MNALEIFLTQWWPLCLGMGVVMAGVWFVGRSASHGYFLFTSPKAFGELAGYSENEQKRLLQEASKETFHSWSSVLPPIAFALVLSAGIALGRTIPKVTTLPDSWWVHMIVAALFGGAAAWFVKQFSVSCVRPFLRRLIEKTSHVA